MKNNQAPWYQSVSSKKGSKSQPSRHKEQKNLKKDPPILNVKITPEKEAAHFQAAFDYAMKMSNPNSTEMITIHMTMDGNLLFDAVQDDHFKTLWANKELMCLIEIPRNWKTMTLIDLDEEALEDLDLDNPEDRFDYLYETGMFIAE